MLKEETVFGQTIYRVECPDKTIYKDENYLNQLNEFFEFTKQKCAEAGQRVAQENEGEADSTVVFGSNPEKGIFPLMFPEGQRFREWFSKVIFENAEQIVGFKPNDVKIYRNWINRMYEGCSGQIHSHEFPESSPYYQHRDKLFVCIFYINDAADGGADLVFVDGDAKNKKFIHECSSEDLQYMNVKEGEMIVHPCGIPHGVSEHKNSDPRVCMIIEVMFT